MIPLLAAAGVADTAGKIVGGAVSVWKHVTSTAAGKKPEDPGSFASLLAGQSVDMTSQAQGFASAALALAPGHAKGSAGPAQGSGGSGAIDRVA